MLSPPSDQATPTETQAQSPLPMTAPLVFDRFLLRTRRRRAGLLGPATFLIDRVADDLADRLSAVLRRFELALDLGTPTGAIGRALAASGAVGAVVRADALASEANAPGLHVVADEEALP